MIDLTKGVNLAQNAIQKTTSTAQKAVETITLEADKAADKTMDKVASDIDKIDFINQCAREQSMMKLPEYIQKTIDHLGR